MFFIKTLNFFLRIPLSVIKDNIIFLFLYVTMVVQCYLTIARLSFDNFIDLIKKKQKKHY